MNEYFLMGYISRAYSEFPNKVHPDRLAASVKASLKLCSLSIVKAFFFINLANASPKLPV
jgi:hypothetical protein